MKRDQKAFSLVAVLLILVIFVLIGLVGWYVWSINQKTLTRHAAGTISKPDGWRSFKSAAMKVSFNYPSSLEVSDQSTMTTTEGDTTYKSPAIFLEHPDRHKDVNYKGPNKFPGIIIYGFEKENFMSGRNGAGQFNQNPIHLTAGKRIIKNLVINGQTYQLVDYTDFLALAKCDPNNNCTNTFARTDGTYIAVTIDIIGGDTNEADPKLDDSNHDYTVVVKVLESLVF